MELKDYKELLEKCYPAEVKLNEGKRLFVVLNGTWKWRLYKTYNTNFGWCIYPADNEAKESLRKAFHCPEVFARVTTKGGKEQLIRVPVPVWTDRTPENNIYWFEYGQKTLDSCIKELAHENKRFGWGWDYVTINADEIPSEYWYDNVGV